MSDSHRIRRALISVWDKTGLIEFAQALHQEFGIALISTGGTARTLREAGLPVTLVEDVTGFPEMMDGRVKTLHPKIHAALLADRDNPEHLRQLAAHGIDPIDMVVVNLYPFTQTIARPGCTFAEAIEMIDIGGPCLLRAAAKNHQHMLVVSQPQSYPQVLDALRNWDDEATRAAARRAGAQAAFWSTCGYDADVSAWLDRDQAGRPARRTVRLRRQAGTRYGENPHQAGEFLLLENSAGSAALARQVGQAETEVSFNNYADASAALELCAELTRAGSGTAAGAAHRGPAAACFIKHTNACGAALSDDPVAAYRQAYLGDPNAAMGGILAVNFPVTAALAEVVMDTLKRFGKPLKEAGHPLPPQAFFVEVWLAPAFDEEAVAVIRSRKTWGRRVRLLEVGDLAAPPDPNELDLKRIAGGVLMQTRDLVGLNEEQWQVVTSRAPSAAELADLRLAWLVCKHTKSNAITVCKDGMLLGNGAGQMSRVMSCRIATWLARENGHADRLAGAVAASDAFFPFRDGPDILADAGVTALIQPGGSKNDTQVIDACNERGIAMLFTGTRHFRH